MGRNSNALSSFSRSRLRPFPPRGGKFLTCPEVEAAPSNRLLPPPPGRQKSPSRGLSPWGVLAVQTLPGRNSNALSSFSRSRLRPFPPRGGKFLTCPEVEAAPSNRLLPPPPGRQKSPSRGLSPWGVLAVQTLAGRNSNALSSFSRSRLRPFPLRGGKFLTCPGRRTLIPQVKNSRPRRKNADSAS